MGIFKKTILEMYEQQFRTKELHNKHLFYDLYAKVRDPEELRSFILETIHNMDWKTSVNELTKWEEEESEDIFRGGRLKPVRSVLKSHNEIIKGSMFPMLWKFLGISGFIMLLIYIYLTAQASAIALFNKNLVLAITPLLFALSIILYNLKEKVKMAVWVKVAGIYDIANEESDVRIIIAGDAEKADKEAFNKMEGDLVELYDVLSRRYVKKKDLSTKTVKEIGREIESGKKEPASKVLTMITEIDQNLEDLEDQLAKGKISEATYKEVREDLLKRRTKVETLVELMKLE